jgi:site-specific DNA-methyltransferase (adenine-specific)
MIPKIIIGQAVIYAGNNLDILPELQSNSVDSIVCDPPYELGFMGKSWDNSGIAYSVELWQQCLRVLKPGGHLLAFGGTRTWHRLAVAIEDAGFEIRDNIAWLYGSGFPKSHNISKAIDKAAGAEREIITDPKWIEKYPNGNGGNHNRGKDGIYGAAECILGKPLTTSLPATDDAKQWDGWGTALKPAHEPIVVARKPLIGTVAENVLKYGTGGLNIDATRITYQSETDRASATPQGRVTSNINAGAAPDVDDSGRREVNRPDNSNGRFPANIILDETTAELLDEQSGITKTGGGNKGAKPNPDHVYKGGWKLINSNWKPDSGGASRFFYVAKASKRDRNEGLDELPEVRHADRNVTDCVGGDNPRNRTNQAKQNFHPTVKPTALMQYLIRLVTPENGLVLDPFCGSGSTGKAAILEGKRFIGIELTPEYLPIIEGRLKHAYLTLDDKEADLFE